jgi:ACT domain-containing protein
MDANERAKNVPNDCVKGAAFIADQLVKLNKELAKTGAKIIVIHGMDSYVIPTANVSIAFSAEALDEYIAQSQ